MGQEPFGVGIIGYGSSARVFHIPFISASPFFRLRAIVQRQTRAGQPDAATELPDVTLYRRVDDLLRDKQIDVVIITTPPASHYQLAADALRSGKHVVVEKPFTPTYVEAEQLVELAAKTNALLTIYQNRRWDSDFVAVSDLMARGVLGRVVDFESHFDRFRPEAPANTWKADPAPGNGAIYDLGTHLIDQVVHLFGMPARVTGFADGMLATIRAGVMSPQQEQLRFWVRGDRGAFRKNGFDPQEAQLKKGWSPSDPGFGEEADQPNRGVISLAVPQDGATTMTESEHVDDVPPERKTYAEFYRRLALAMWTGDATLLPVAPDEAAQVIRLVELLKESSSLGRTLRV
ncbi:hypothetical protein M409DRAFT_63224 [Zasmidium cellare ATCC 36951]|uniref:Gfo/Idh/MocA-like oxidoreductase N-terminal domain-containing protein n=1 Tax=Zasmidium cellare ATCC 36951 TaxID=1080233 RepID=A0A6A6D344_ZASCE|nr:uncharacterized protein M409DRAFT_63224 [Zasmidium cellare ATCC 36951]KAF2172549.1 hypothetical protein M409DRAFT_63224 [Zasmidium cellare ATCC 36951]